MQKIQHKKGDTFKAANVFRNAAGEPASISGYTITSQVRTSSGKLVASLTVTSGAGLGEFTVSGQTSTWPLGNLHWDIQFLQGTEIFSTQTTVIEMVKDVTQ